MKLLLVNPNFTGIVFTPSLGLGFIGTYVKQNSECEVEIVEPILQGMNEEFVIEKALRSDIIGVVCYTESRFECFKFAERVKTLNDRCMIVVGGPHVNTLDKLIIHYYPFIDVVVRMEGEEAVLDIVKGIPFDEIPGITWRRGNEVVRNPDRQMAKNIDRYNYDYSLAFPNVGMWKDLEIPINLQRLNALPIIASRGCPYHCAFCAANRLWANSYRGLDPVELVDRIANLIDLYQIGYFRFYDALFIGNEKRIIEFCDLLQKRELNIHFRIDIRVGTREKVLRRLKEVGCEIVGFGVESGSDRVLKKMNKGITREQTEETLRLCKDLGLWTIGFFMVCLPGETIEDVQKTFELFKYCDRLNVQFFKVHPNTAVYDELLKRGEIHDQIWFDPNAGDQTQYGNEIYYCKENFSSALFSMDEGNLLVESSTYRYHITNPGAVLNSYSLSRGILTILLSFVLDPLLRWNRFRNFYMEFKKTFAFSLLKNAYKRLH